MSGRPPGWRRMPAWDSPQPATANAIILAARRRAESAKYYATLGAANLARIQATEAAHLAGRYLAITGE